MSQAIRVLIVDDSALMRQIIAGLLEQDPAITVVGKARNGREAIGLVQTLHPDIVTMDVRMPVMDGLEATEYLMAHSPTPILVVTSSLERYDIDITFKMLAAGALEVFEKPSARDQAQLARAGQMLAQRVKVLARVKVVTHLRGRRRGTGEAQRAMVSVLPPAHSSAAQPAPDRGTPVLAVTPAPFPLLVIGASTGGPRVVNQLISALPRQFPAAILVVQHIAAGFSGGMAEWLSYSSALPVRLAEEGGSLQPGHVLIAPDQTDLLISPGAKIHLSDNPLLLQRPSIDISMQAAAEVFGARAIGVLLTGMGRDGAYGMLTIKRAGGYTIAQDEATSTIFGMPRAAIHLGAACEVLPAQAIAGRVVEVVNRLARTSLALDPRGKL